jgi:hypothetical protein
MNLWGHIQTISNPQPLLLIGGYENYDLIDEKGPALGRAENEQYRQKRRARAKALG